MKVGPKDIFASFPALYYSRERVRMRLTAVRLLPLRRPDLRGLHDHVRLHDRVRHHDHRGERLK